jgi:uncharacterized protein
MPDPTPDPTDADRLEDELRALGEDAMLLEEFDGFVAGLLVCPEMIPPSEWLPLALGSDDDSKAVFDDLDHANRVLRLVMDHYNLVASMLQHDPAPTSRCFRSRIAPAMSSGKSGSRASERR